MQHNSHACTHAKLSTTSSTVTFTEKHGLSQILSKHCLLGLLFIKISLAILTLSIWMM